MRPRWHAVAGGTTRAAPGRVSEAGWSRRTYGGVMDAATFPQLTARDLDGREVVLPAGLPGELTVVLVAFRRSHQALVDSWVPWLEARMAMDSRLRVVELPVLALHWAPGRSAIAAS